MSGSNFNETTARPLTTNSSGETTGIFVNSTYNGVNLSTSAGATNFLNGEGNYSVPSVAWGTITGTLTSQSDLNTALNLKGDISGETFVLGSYNGVTLSTAEGSTNFLNGGGSYSVPPGVPGGDNTHVQFNNSSAFGGDSLFTFNDPYVQIGDGTGTNTTAGALVVHRNGTSVEDQNAFPNVVSGIHLLGDNTAKADLVIENVSTTASTAPRLLFERGRTGPVIAVNGDVLGDMLWRGYDGNTAGAGSAPVYRDIARIRAEINGTPGLNDLPTKLIFSATPDGSVTLTDYMTLSPDGNFGIGTPTPEALFHVRDGDSSVASWGGNFKGIIESSGSTYLGIAFGDGVNDNAGLFFANENNSLQAGFFYNEGDTGTLQIRVGNNLTKMTLNEVGQMYMSRAGGSPPNEAFPNSTAVIDVRGTGGLQSNIISTHQSQTAAAASKLILRRRGDTPNVGNNSDVWGLGQLVFQGYDDPTNGAYRTGANIKIQSTEEWTTSTLGTQMDIQTVATGSTALTTRIKIDGSGNVGIGETSPDAKLHVDNQATNKSLYVYKGGTEALDNDTNSSIHIVGTQANSPDIFLDKNSDASGIELNFRRSKNSLFVGNNDDLGTLTFYGWGTVSGPTDQFIPAAQIIAEVNGTPGTGSMPGVLRFLTTPIGSTSPVEAMRINEKGEIGIGFLEPETLVHIKESTAGGNYNNLNLADTQLIVERAGEVSIAIIGLQGNKKSLYFGDGSASGSVDEGEVGYTGSGSSAFMSFSVNNNVRMTIDANGDVGIGETDPFAPLHVKTGDSGVSGPLTANRQLVLEGGDGGSGMIILGSNDSGTELSYRFGRGVDNEAGIFYSAATAPIMQFRMTGNAVKMTINDQGVIFNDSHSTNNFTFNYNPTLTTDIFPRFIGEFSTSDGVVIIDISDAGNSFGATSQFRVTRQFGQTPVVEALNGTNQGNGTTGVGYDIHFFSISGSAYQLFYLMDKTGGATNAFNINFTVQTTSQGPDRANSDPQTDDIDIDPCDYSYYSRNANTLKRHAIGGKGTGGNSALLSLESTSQGFLPPRMDLGQRNGIGGPTNGLIIYNSTTNLLNLRAGGSWVSLTTGAAVALIKEEFEDKIKSLEERLIALENK